MTDDHNSEGGEEGRQTRKGRVGRIMEWECKVPVPPIPNTNFAFHMLKLFSQYGENTALVDVTTEKSYSYGDLCRMVLRMRSRLTDAGVGPGDAVILISSNHINMPAVFFSVMLSGAICVPVNPALTTEELTHVIRVSEAKWAVVNKSVIATVEAAFSSLGPNSLKQTWVLDDISETTGPSSGELMKSALLESTVMNEDFDSAKTVALMPFSSGTTGLPKGVMLTHRNLLTTCFRIKYKQSLSQNRSFNVYESTLMILPMYHIYGYNMTNYALICGGKVVILTKFSPKEYFKTIQSHKVTCSPLVPHIMKFLVATPLLEQYDISSLKLFTTGSSPISETTLGALTKKSGKVARQGYALTESCGMATSNGGVTGYKANSVGKLGPFFQGKVIDVETGQLLSAGEEGELCLRGPAIMLGYANNPKATAETIDSEGWLHTGDVCYYDDENFLFITDRIKDLIKVKSYQVSPTELENIIRKVENVNEVAVAGVPNERFGEAPRAWVVPAKGANIDTKALIKHVADHVAPYKQLIGGVEVVESLPKNHLGKILRKQLSKSYLASRSKL